MSSNLPSREEMISQAENASPMVSIAMMLWLMAFMIIMGMSSSIYMISIMSSLQLLVPDRMRGRVMGFYGMTWSIMPLSATQAGAMASFIGVPFAIAIGGILVAAFALGPALVNKKLWNVGTLLMEAEESLATQSQTPSQTRPAHAGGND